MNGTAEATFKKAPLPEGNSKQNTTTGINLLATNKSIIKSMNANGVWNNNIYTVNGLTVTFEFDDNDCLLSVTINGTATANTNIRLDVNVRTYPAGTYTAYECQMWVDTTSEWFGGTTPNALVSKTFAEEWTTASNLLYFANGTTVNNFEYTPMILNGSYTKNTLPSYEPYTGKKPSPNSDYEQPILSAGDNGRITEIIEEQLINKNNILNIWFQPSTIWALDNKAYTTYFECKPNTTYIIERSKILDVNNFRVGSYKSLGTNAERTNYVAGAGLSSVTITSGPDDKYILVYFYWYNDTTYTYQEILDTLKAYSQEQTYTIPCQQPMRSLGNVRDKFVKVNDNWYERHNIYRKIFTGAEAVTKGGTTSNNQFIMPDLITNADRNYLGNYNDDVISQIKSNNFIPIGTTSNNNGSIGITLCRYSPNPQVRFGLGASSEITTIETFKSLLAGKYSNGNPVYLDYILGTPTDLPCTSAQIEVLNALEKAISYKGATNIFSTDKISPNFDVIAYRDAELAIINLESKVELLEN